MSKPPRKKTRREETADREGSMHAEVAIAQSLVAYGERFLQMFDDAEQPRRTPKEASRAAASSEDASGSESGGRASSSSGGCGSGCDSVSEEEASGPEEYIFDSREVVRSAGKSKSARRTAAASPASPARPATSPPGSTAARLDRRRFMSPKAAVQLGEDPGSMAPSLSGRGTAPSGEEAGPSRADFLQFQREVQLYGASALDKKAKRRFEAGRLGRLGARAEKGPRISATIGLGMAKKQAKRDARALEEGIAAGMIKAKGRGKAKRREQRSSMDRGLAEDGGAFRNGVLRVKRGGKGGGGRGGGKAGGVDRPGRGGGGRRRSSGLGGASGLGF